MLKVGLATVSQQLSGQFDPLINKPITKLGLESKMLFIQELPGINISAVLSRGVSAGESDLIINVQDEVSNEFQLYIDNQGIEQTGSTRLRFSYTANNPTFSGDKFTFILQTSDFINAANRGTAYGSFSYSVPLGGETDSFFDLNYGVNRYQYDGQPLDLEGETTFLSIGFRSYWIKTRELQLYNTWVLRNDSSEYSREGSPTGDNQRPNLDSATLSFGFQQLSKSTHSLNSGSIEYVVGIPGFGLGGTSRNLYPSDRNISTGTNELPTDFERLGINLTRLQSITEEYSLLFKYRAQFSNDSLFSIFQRTLGGSGDVRSLPNAYYIRDNYQYGSIEWILNSPGISDVPYDEGLTWGQVLQFSFFYDYSSGYDNNPLLDNDNHKVHVSGYGFGLQFNHPDFIYFKLSLGVPTVSDGERTRRIDSDGGSPFIPLDNPLFFSEFRYSF